MSSGPWIARVALGIVVALLAVGLSRAVFLYIKGVQVVVVDWHKPLGRALGDMVAGCVLAVWAFDLVLYGLPLADRSDPWSLGLPVIENVWLRSAGLAVLACGAVLYCVALFALGRSWRIGIDPENSGPLVTTGLYGSSRHPIYAAFMLVFVGAYLALGMPSMLVLGAAGCLTVHLYALLEERFLTGLYGDAYRDYSRQVGMYFSLPKRNWNTTGELDAGRK